MITFATTFHPISHFHLIKEYRPSQFDLLTQMFVKENPLVPKHLVHILIPMGQGSHLLQPPRVFLLGMFLLFIMP